MKAAHRHEECVMTAPAVWRLRGGRGASLRGGFRVRFATRSLVALAVLALQASCQHVPPRPLSPEEAGRAFMSRSLDEAELRSFLEAALEEPLPEWPLPPLEPRDADPGGALLPPGPGRRSRARAARGRRDPQRRSAPEPDALRRARVQHEPGSRGLAVAGRDPPRLADRDRRQARATGSNAQVRRRTAARLAVSERGVARPPPARVRADRLGRGARAPRLPAPRGDDGRAPRRSSSKSRVDAGCGLPRRPRAGPLRAAPGERRARGGRGGVRDAARAPRGGARRPRAGVRGPRAAATGASRRGARSRRSSATRLLRYALLAARRRPRGPRGLRRLRGRR